MDYLYAYVLTPARWLSLDDHCQVLFSSILTAICVATLLKFSSRRRNFFSGHRNKGNQSNSAKEDLKSRNFGKAASAFPDDFPANMIQQMHSIVIELLITSLLTFFLASFV
jgi:hypothetical protein